MVSEIQKSPAEIEAGKLEQYLTFSTQHSARKARATSELMDALGRTKNLDSIISTDGGVSALSQETAALHMEIQISESALVGVHRGIPGLAVAVHAEAGRRHGKWERIAKAIEEKARAEAREDMLPRCRPEMLDIAILSSKAYLEIRQAIELCRPVGGNFEERWVDVNNPESTPTSTGAQQNTRAPRMEPALKDPAGNAKAILVYFNEVTAALAKIEAIAVQQGINPNLFEQ